MQRLYNPNVSHLSNMATSRCSYRNSVLVMKLLSPTLRSRHLTTTVGVSTSSVHFLFSRSDVCSLDPEGNSGGWNAPSLCYTSTIGPSAWSPLREDHGSRLGRDFESTMESVSKCSNALGSLTGYDRPLRLANTLPPPVDTGSSRAPHFHLSKATKRKELMFQQRGSGIRWINMAP